MLSFALFSSVWTHGIAAQRRGSTASPSYGDSWKKPVVFTNSTNQEMNILVTTTTKYTESNRTQSAEKQFTIGPNTTTNKPYSVNFFDSKDSTKKAVFSCILKVNNKKTKSFQVIKNEKTLKFILAENLAETKMVEV